MKKKEEMLEAGEYCGICGKTPRNEKDYKANEKRCWYCSDECQKIADEQGN